MADLVATRITGDSVTLDLNLVTDFQMRLRSAVLHLGVEGYDRARRVWNGNIDRKPALIVCCTGVADIIEAVNFARTHQLPIAVRGGGHNAAGHATCNGGMVVDLTLMKGIQVDPRRRTARAQGGCTWAEFDRETQVFAL